MRPRTLLILVLTAAVVFAALSLTRRNAPVTEISTAALFPGLIDEVNGVEHIAIRTHDKQTVLRREGARWVVGNRDGFPTEFTNVKRTLMQLAALKVVEKKTAKPENYARLGVAGVDAADSASTLVTVAGPDAKVYAELIVGKARSAKGGKGSGRYVRPARQAHAVLTDGDLEVSADPIDWVDASLADIPTKRVHRVSIQPRDGPAVVISKASPAENFFELENIPAGFRLKSKPTVSSLGAILTGLRFTDVAAQARLAPEVVPRTIVEIQTFDGLVTTLEEIDYEDKVFVRFDFEFNPDVVVPDTTQAGPAVTPSPPSPPSAGGAPPAASAPSGDQPSSAARPAAPADQPAAAAAGATAGTEAVKTPPSVEAEAKTLNARTAGWMFELPEYKLRMIDKKLDDLIVAAEDAATAAPSPTPAAK